MTPTTSANTYCTGSRFLDFYDARTVGDLVTVDGTRSLAPAASARLGTMLLAASGMVEAACLPGGRYTPEDLAALTGAGKALLEQTVASLAAQMLRENRGRPDDKPLPSYQAAMNLLEQLRKGEKIFGFVEVQEAGQLSVQPDTQENRVTQNGVVIQASAYFGSRSWRKRF